MSVLTADQLDSILQGNVHKKIPDAIYLANLQAKYDEMKAITGVNDTKEVEFIPEKHLTVYANPDALKEYNETRRLTLEELQLTNPDQISPIAVSDPFPLFTMEAVNLMRQEVMSRELFLEFARFCYSSTSGKDVAMRGYVKNEEIITAPFTYAAWTHPKTQALIDQMAGTELDIVMDYEIAHLNVSVNNCDEIEREEQIAKAKAAVKKRGSSVHDESNGGANIPAVVGWHKDSYPFVCVLMLSDTSDMIGGETHLRKGNGNVAMVEGPQQGYASILQGRVIEHLAPNPLGLAERITMVTSYRPKNDFDMSVLSTVKPEINYGTRYSDFYSQWVTYRMTMAQTKTTLLRATAKIVDGKFKKEEAIKQLQELEQYIHATWNEMLVDDNEWQNAKLGFLK